LPWEITDWQKNLATSDVTVTKIDVSSSAATGIKTWDGFKMIKNSDGSYKQETALTRNLSAQGYIPQKGKIYNANTTIYIKNLYINSCPVDKNGLIFYADLNYNYANLLTGDESNSKIGILTNNMGLNCVKLTETARYDDMMGTE
jgi:hypothetical protein